MLQYSACVFVACFSTVHQALPGGCNWVDILCLAIIMMCFQLFEKSECW